MKSMKKNRFRLGNLILALYDEAEKLTSNKRIQTVMVYLALRDMTRHLRPVPLPSHK